MKKYSCAFLFLLALLLPLQGVRAHVLTASGPVAQMWYFAEGRVGSGFRTFFSIDNPNSGECAVKLAYAYVLDGSDTNQTKMVNIVVPANSRYTENANADVPGPSTLSATVSVDTGATPTCSGIVVERPMYLDNFHSVNSGTDVLGATNLNTTFYFADVPTHAAGESFLSIYNPGDVSANVTVMYYSGGSQVGNTATLSVATNSRGTIQPNADINLPSHVGAVVTSDRAILVERPTYYVDEYGVSGSADVVGTSTLAGDWLFSEGNTSSGTQENLALANFGDTDAPATITLKSLSGATHDFNVIVKAHGQLIWNVNNNNSFTGGTSEVAAEVKSVSNTLAVQRQMYTTYAGSNGNSSWSAQGVTDTFGATAGHGVYSFAEGFTSLGFNEYLLLQNPSNTSENVNVTLVNMLGHSYTQNYTIGPQSRYTINITSLVENHLVNSGEDARAYAESMTVQSSDGSNFVAERTMHWSAFETEGAESVVGYAAG